jgi:outer membrane immunogenic protein
MRNILIATTAIAAISGTALAEGARIEVHGAYDNVDRRGTKAFDGIDYGLGIGYDYNVNENAFIGIEANVDDSNADRTTTVPNGSTTTKINRDLNANLRIGTAVGDQKTKVYGLVGYTNLRFKTIDFSTLGTGSTTIVNSSNADGYRVGAGVERSFGSRAYGKIEYRYSNYEGGFSRNQGLVGVGLRF